MSEIDFERLPVEILHRILDNLDIETILLSFRYVSKRFYSIVNTYNSYNFNFESISKRNFYLITQIIPFKYVISLTLSNKDKTNGQIQVFLSLFNLNEFIHLHSLTLLHIEDNYLIEFLNFIPYSSIKYLSIDSKIFNIRKNISLNLLSLTIGHSSLEKLELNMWPKDMNELQWPNNCFIKYLRLRNSITVHQFFRILEYSPYLKTILLKDFNIDDKNEINSNGKKFLQLVSLTCEGGRIQIDKLEQCLISLPSLEYLKLIGNGNLFNSTFDGQYWEEFITKYLPLLKNFEFFISVLTHVNFDTSYIQQIISLFQTSFWLNKLQCSIKCDYIIYLHKLILYTIPICQNHFEYYSKIHKVSSSNFSQDQNESTMMIMDNIKQANLFLTQIINQDETENETCLLFRNLNELCLSIDGEWPKGSLKFLRTTIDFSNITKLSLSVNFFHEYMPSIVSSIKKLLTYATNIHTLSLFDYCAPDNCTTTMEFVCSMINSNIKHLEICVKNSDDIKFIIENLHDLKSVTFHYAQSLMFHQPDFIDCLSDIKRFSSRWESQYALHIWLDKSY